MKSLSHFSGVLILASSFLIAASLKAFEAANFSLTQQSKSSWTSIPFEEPFDAPPIVVAGPISRNGGDPATLRVRKVTTEGFQVQLKEWDYRDGTHVTETFSYLAVPSGQHNIEGLPTVSGKIASVGQNLTKYEFERPFDTPPIILFQVEASDSSPALVVRPRRITKEGFELRIQAEERNQSRLTPRPVHFVAFKPGDYIQSNGQTVTTGNTGNKVTHAWFGLSFPKLHAEPVFLAHMQTSNGGNPASLRQRNLKDSGVQLKVEEERSLDSEVNHIAEEVGYIIIGASVDSDLDGLPDSWEEAHGLDPKDPSDANEDPDADGLTNLDEYTDASDPRHFDGTLDGGVLRLVTENPSAYEKELLSGSIRLIRDQSNAPILVPLIVEPNPDPTKSAAQASDYRLLDSTGQPIPNPIPLAAGQRSVEIIVAPVRDSLAEVPETLRIRIAPTSHYQVSDTANAEITLYDATNIPENERLFVATLRPEDGVETSAFGLSTLRVQGDNRLALVNLSFSGLSSPQTAVHIHLANPVSGPPLESLELGQVTDHWWFLRATQFLTTDQQALDALTNGKLYINVHSANFPAGEIRGDFRQQAGSVALVPLDPPPAIEELSEDELDRDIARLLMQSTYGPTPKLMASVKEHITRAGDRIEGMANWIAEHMNPETKPPISLLELTRAADKHEASFFETGASAFRPHNLRHGWWLMAMQGKDQLRQRIAFALSQIFVISTKDSLINNRHYGAAHYYDMLSQGAFGSYRDLLENVTKHPIMGHYLSHLRNQREVRDDEGKVIVSPDENFAREIMQLFSIGLVERHLDGTIKLDTRGLPIATYDQNDITELARVMTGFSFSKRNFPRNSDTVRNNTRFSYGNGSRGFQAQWTHPMRFFEQYHDQREKTLIDGSQTKAFQGGERDLDDALDALTRHANTAPFISRLLIQRLVSSNPTRGYVFRVASVFKESRGQLGEVIKAILLDPEARSLKFADRVDAGKQKEPIIRYVAFCRALNVASKLPLSDLTKHGYPEAELAKFPKGTSLYRMGNTDNRLAQTPQSAPTVFNWFLPDFTVAGPLAAGGLVAPEFQVTTESQVVNAANAHYTIAFNRNGQGGVRIRGQNSALDDHLIPDLTPFRALLNEAAANNATKLESATLLVDYIDLLLSGGSLETRYRNQVGRTPRDIMIEAVAATRDPNMIKTAIYLYVTSPEYITLK